MANRKFIPEILDEINADPSKLKEYKDHAGLKMIFDYAFNPAKKFDLPEGEPPFKKDAAPIGMSPANLMMELRRLYVFTKERELPKVRRETLFIQLLENLHPSESVLLCAVKDQKLSKLYKKITADLLVDNSFLPEEFRAKKDGSPRKKS